MNNNVCYEKLESVCTLITDGSHFSPKSIPTGYPMLSVKDMRFNGFDYSECNHISKQDFEILKKNGCVPIKNDVLIAKDGSYLKEIFVVDENKEEAILSSIGILRPNMKKINPYFLKYYLSTDYIKRQVGRKYVTGSALPRIILKNFKDIDIPQIPLDYQEKIVNLLRCIDLKIINNNKINLQLESLAKTLYDYWFLQFEFPNEEGKPYKSSGGKMVYNEQLKKEIPEGWEVKELLSFSYWESASQPPKSEFIYRQQEGYVRFVQNRDYESDANITYVPLRKHTKLCDEYDILIDKYGDKTSGTVRYGLNGAYNVALGKLTPTIKNSQEYIRYYLSTKNMFDYLHNACMASTRSSMNETVFKGIFVPIPINIVLENFEKFSKKIIDKKLSLKKENKELISLRDFLLPLLMNGQVTIQDAEVQVKNTISNVWNAEKLLRFAQWKQIQGYAARGEVDEETLMKIFDAMDKDAKK